MENFAGSHSENLTGNRFTSEVLNGIRREIGRTGGNEVLFFGWTDGEGRVSRVQVVARGNEECVAVPIERSFLPDLLIHNHPDGRLAPSEPDMRIASAVADRGVGFLIVDNDVTRLYAVVEPVGKKIVRPIDGERLCSLLAAGGPFSRCIPDFEEREGQKQMIRHVCDSFNQDAFALIEAGTGIGKSVAYLIPSIEWSLVNRERIVVSTNTINLQEQLIHKDIPDLKRALGLEFSHVLMKGRGNYACLNRIAEIRQDLVSFLDDEEAEQFGRIVEWLEITEDGSLSDLGFAPKPSVWEKISSSSEMCLGGGCGFFSRCFVNRVKRKAATAHLVVTNHHYLLADATLTPGGASILPSYERLVVDEGHNLEDSATSFFTRTVTLAGTLRLLNRLYNEGKQKGYLIFLSKQGLIEGGPDLERVKDDFKRVKADLSDLFKGIGDLFSRMAVAWRDGADVSIIEMNDEFLENPFWEREVSGYYRALQSGLGKLVKDLIELGESLVGKDEDRAAKQLGGYVTRLSGLLGTLDLFVAQEGPERRDYARWIEKRKEPAITVSLVDVGGMLGDLLFKHLKSVVLTSATLTVSTLTVSGGFGFLRSRLSLDREAIEAVIPSPFQYDRQMAVLLPTDMVEPDHPGYLETLADCVTRILHKTRGKAFVLFTSYRTMNDIYERLEGQLALSGFLVFRQGGDSRRNLLDRFKADVHSILFGTESFWEGVDVPGEALECVIITKLPFKVPTEPIVKARLARIRESGGDPFLEYSLPSAVMKMKQGTGRLIRNGSDRGIVAILDKRVQTKRYGKAFLDSLPGGTSLRGPLAAILEESGGFLTNYSLTNSP